MTATLVSPMAMAPSSIFDVMSRITAVSAVPASEPFRPWLASIEMAAEVVSTSMPAALQFAAQFLKAWPRPSTVVLALACA